MHLTLNQYPDAIADLQRQLKQKQFAVRQLKESVAVCESAIDRAIAFDKALTNDNQRKAKRQELREKDGDLIRYKTELAKTEAIESDLEIELNLLLNQFSVLKLERREAIVNLEIQSRLAA